MSAIGDRSASNVGPSYVPPPAIPKVSADAKEAEQSLRPAPASGPTTSLLDPNMPMRGPTQYPNPYARDRSIKPGDVT